LTDAVQRVRAAGEACVGTDDTETWHALRIEARRLRYSIEAFGDVLAEEPTRELLKRVTRVQDHLGAMQDAAVAIDAVARFLEQQADEVSESTAERARAYMARREAQIVRRRQSFAGVWSGIAGVGFDRALKGAMDQSLAEQLTER
jgi:CHAD domain-containing protein